MLRIKSVDFGTTGLSGSMGYRLINVSGSLTLARTNSGIITFGSGAYFAEINIPDNWSGVVLWDDGKTPRIYAHETLYKDSYGSRPSYIGSVIQLITGTHLQSRIPGSIKRDTGGTFSYALIAQIGTHLLGRIPGTVKRGIEGTFAYAQINQIGTHLVARTGSIAKLGTHLQSRIPGTIKKSIEGTFSYSNIALILGLGTHLQSRITGSMVDVSALGTHLNSRIPGSVATKGDMGSVKGAGFSTVTDSLKQIRDSATGGSTPSYIGSILWSKNPNNFTSPDTFGQRISKILERASSGLGGIAVSAQIFNEKEKKLLFDWIKVMIDRMAAIEKIMAELNPETKKIISEFFTTIKTNQTKLEEALQHFLKLDTKQKEGIRNDINFIATSFDDITVLNTAVKKIREDLVRIEHDVQLSMKESAVGKLSSIITLQSQDLRSLLNQSINIANDVSARLAKNLITLAEDRKSLAFTEKAILSLVPTDKLKELIE